MDPRQKYAWSTGESEAATEGINLPAIQRLQSVNQSEDVSDRRV